MTGDDVSVHCSSASASSLKLAGEFLDDLLQTRAVMLGELVLLTELICDRPQNAGEQLMMDVKRDMAFFFALPVE